MESEYWHKSYNVRVLLYHMVFPAKYRKAVIDKQVEEEVKEVCLEIEKRYEMKFLEIGADENHMHFLVQSVPTYAVRKRVRVVTNLKAKEVFRRCPQVKKQLWGGEFWTEGYYVSTVGQHGTEEVIGK
jgi:REP element-mobilizing transposase RayT